MIGNLVKYIKSVVFGEPAPTVHKPHDVPNKYIQRVPRAIRLLNEKKQK